MNTKGNTKENEDVLVNLDIDNHIGTLQLNRPTKLNALRGSQWKQFIIKALIRFLPVSY